MELLSAFYAQRGKNEASLLLQQYHYKQVQIVFACICGGEGADAGRAGGYMAEQILQWFREQPVKRLCRNQEKCMDWLEGSLREVIWRTDNELANSRIMRDGHKVDLAGIFCMDYRCLMLKRGVGDICLINTAFGHAHLRHMYREEEGGIMMEQGMLQPDIAVLLAMKSFYQYVTDEMIRDGLAVDGVATEEQMGRHLKELGREGERLGGVKMDAVLLRTR